MINIIKRNLCATIIILISVLCSFMYLFSDNSYYINSSVSSLSDSVELNNDEAYQQVISGDSSIDEVAWISLRFDTHSQVVFGDVIIEVVKNGTLMQTWHIKTQELIDDKYIDLKLDSVLRVTDEDCVVITVSCVLDEGASIAVYQDIRVKCMAHSIWHRLIIAFLILFSGVITGLIINANVINRFYYINTVSQNSISLLYFIAIIVLIFYAIVFEHDDGPTLTEWGVKLLECAHYGDFSNYSDYIRYGDYFSVSNYNIAVNILTAVVVFPVYLFNTVIPIGDDFILVCDLFRKVFLIVVVLITEKQIKKYILSVKGCSYTVASLISMMYIVSPIVLCVLGMGQVDCIAALLIVVSMNMVITKRYPKAFLLLSLSILVKPFSLFVFGIPILLILLKRISYSEVMRCLISFFSPLIISFFLSNFLFGNYGKLQSIFMVYSGHVGIFFKSVWADNSLFILGIVIVYGCLLLLPPAEDNYIQVINGSGLIISILLLLFVHQNPQWLTYPLISMLLLTPYIIDLKSSGLLLSCYYLGSMLYSYTRFKNNVDLVIIGKSIIAKPFDICLVPSYTDYIDTVFPSLSPYASNIGKSIVTGCVILFLILWLTNNKQVKHDDELLNRGNNPLPITRVIYSIISSNIVLCILFGEFSILAYFDVIIYN